MVRPVTYRQCEHGQRQAHLATPLVLPCCSKGLSLQAIGDRAEPIIPPSRSATKRSFMARRNKGKTWERACRETCLSGRARHCNLAIYLFSHDPESCIARAGVRFFEEEGTTPAMVLWKGQDRESENPWIGLATEEKPRPFTT